MAGFYEVYASYHFAAAHKLVGYQGDCAKVHGHNWIIEAYIKCSELDDIGLGIDFRDIKDAIKEILKEFDHTFLNDHPDFQKMNSTSENLAKYFYKRLEKIINTDVVKVSKVKISETPHDGAYYWEE
jgi:6-pyruvoyltetrahydropterin/6-carboxytetrahydropterin synthase